MTKRLSISYIVVLALIAALTTAQAVAVRSVINDYEKKARDKAMIDEQRVLAQQLANAANVFASAQPSQRDGTQKQSLRARIDLLETQHQILTGGEGTEVAAALSPELRGLYFRPPWNVDGQMTEYIRMLRILIGDAEPIAPSERPKSLRYVRAYASTRLSEALETVARQIAREGDDEIRLIGKLQLYVYVLSLILLVGSGLFVFRPMVRRIVSQIRQVQVLNKDLQNAVAVAEDASRAKSRFLSSMSHELRTPLNAIIGFGQLIENDPVEKMSDRHREYLNHITTGGRHLLHLVGEVLEFNRIETGDFEVNLECVDLRDVFDHCLAITRETANDAEIDVVDETVGHDLPHVHADKVRTSQILLNLLSNAVKFSDRGGRVTLIGHPVGSTKFRIGVSDTGIGIPPDQWGRLFEPFERLGHEAGQIAGAGVGLAIAKKIVEKMNGSIGFESTEGAGSMFWIELPVHGET